MKKIFSILLFLFFISHTAFSQWNFGGEIGTNWSKLVNYPFNLNSSSYKQGLNLGILAGYKINRMLGVQSGLLYSMHGFKDKGVFDIIGNNHEIKVTTHNLDLPIALKFYPLKYGVNIQAGVLFEYLFAESVKSEISEAENYLSEKRRRFDIGVIMGVAYDFKNGLFIDIKYNLGLIKQYESIDGLNNRFVQISLGYLFFL
ncbi:porin family protein [Parabacteroides goldsteinii]|uniref:porin family protein n=1 Tax=Parabacteroides goldsteinii TaxID=328812 RepID=UPI002431FBD6|nr:porin family protein [Parabacteroides goldsteinii]